MGVRSLVLGCLTFRWTGSVRELGGWDERRCGVYVGRMTLDTEAHNHDNGANTSFSCEHNDEN